MQDKGFFAVLFDLSFSEFVTTRIIKVLYCISIVLAGIWALAILVGCIANGGAAAFLGLIFAPLLFFFLLLCARLWLEFIIVVFRIAENTAQLVEQCAGCASQNKGPPAES